MLSPNELENPQRCKKELFNALRMLPDMLLQRKECLISLLLQT